MGSIDNAEKEYVHLDKNEATNGSKEERSQDISINLFGDWEKTILKDPKNQLALSALSQNNPLEIIASRAAKIADSQIFNVKIALEGSPVTAQKASGRCWLFAATNTFRIALMRKYGLKEFQLSQSYLFFWDKIEKSNYYLESILETAKDEELDGRLVQALMADPVGDGGQWDMVANLVKKYGLVPHTLYPDSYNATSSLTMRRLLTTKLRENGLILRSLVSSSSSPSEISSAKTKMLEEIHLILTLMLGPPPSPTKDFVWEYYDSENKFQSLTTTPLAFASSLSDPAAISANKGTDVHSLFSLVNDPRNEYNRLLTVNRLGNVKEGRATTYVNVDMKTMKDVVLKMLKEDIPVFFGCDVGKYSDRKTGIMDTRLLEYENAFNVRLGMTKAQRLQAGESAMTHAMVLTGVHLDGEGKPVRWRVENSWSEEAGTKGYFVMSDAWMDEFNYQAVVDPRFVSEEVKAVLKQDPIVLPFWDPMGALA